MRTWLCVLSVMCLILAGPGCKKSKKSSTISLWTVESVDEKAGLIRVSLDIPLRAEVMDPTPQADPEKTPKALDEHRLSGAAVGRLFSDVQEMTVNVDEAVINVDLLMKSIQVAPVQALPDGGHRVSASLPLNGPGSLATVLGCKEVRLKGPMPGAKKDPAGPTPQPTQP